MPAWHGLRHPCCLIGEPCKLYFFHSLRLNDEDAYWNPVTLWATCAGSQVVFRVVFGCRGAHVIAVLERCHTCFRKDFCSSFSRFERHRVDKSGTRRLEFLSFAAGPRPFLWDASNCTTSRVILHCVPQDDTPAPPHSGLK